MKSIFTKIYRYRQTNKKHDIKNYLIEIFSDCLRKDELLRKSFFNKIVCLNFSSEIFTQRTFSNGKRPDIAIENYKRLVRMYK